jgi:hypothetical protein
LRPGNLRVVNLVEVEVVEEVNGALVGMGRVAVVQEEILTPERLETWNTTGRLGKLNVYQ